MEHVKKFSICAGAAVLCLAAHLHSSQQGAMPHFDVVSIRPAASAHGSGWDMKPSNGRWRATSMSVEILIEKSYRVSPRQVVMKLPKSFGKDRFDIEATFPPRTSRDGLLAMVQAMLKDRFNLTFHMAVQPLPAEVIEVARHGSKLAAASGHCLAASAAKNSARSDMPVCGVITVRRDHGAFEWRGFSISMGELTSFLANTSTMPVVDRTHIGGLFDMDVKFDIGAGEGGDDPATYEMLQRARRAAAFRDQLGLVVDPDHPVKVPVKVMIVDHIARPTPN